MTTSYNGWPASKDLPLRPLVVNGVSFSPGIRDDADLEVVFRYIAEQWAERVEPLVSPGCWGFYYRPDRNDLSKLSCHSSGTAIDFNAPRHPNGAEAPPALIATVHPILTSITELADLVHWGGDWHYVNGLTPDPMHFELHAYDPAMLKRVADRIRNLQEDDMPYTEQQLTDIVGKAVKAELADLVKQIADLDREHKALVRKLFANIRVILKERFGATDADLDEILGHLEP